MNEKQKFIEPIIKFVIAFARWRHIIAYVGFLIYYTTTSAYHFTFCTTEDQKIQ